MKMKNKTGMIAVALSLAFLTGCGKQTSVDGSNVKATMETQETEQASEESSSDTASSEEISQEADSQKPLEQSEMFSDRDYETSYDESTSARISLNGTSAESDSDAVSCDGTSVTISDEGTYIISGTLDNGMIIVNAENTDKVQLVLKDAAINSATSAAIYILQADKVFLTLAPDSVNTLSNGGTFTAIDDNNIDAVVFSKDDLTMNGTGMLTITSPAGHGVVSKDDLVITGGEYSITAASQGLCGKESVRIADGVFTITAGKDGIHAEDADDSSLGFCFIADGTYHITAEGDGISASGNLQIENGNFTIQAGGGSDTVTLDSEGNWSWRGSEEQQNTDSAEDTVSAKGIKAGGSLLINDGAFGIDSADDAVHSNANLTVNGGEWKVASGDDGIHADETAEITDGTFSITKSYEGIEGQSIIISGGTIDLVSSDDGLNAAGGNDQSGNGGFGGFQDRGGFDASENSSIHISGGVLHVNASGDGVDSNGTLMVSGGETYVSGPTDSANGALDYNGEATISGGIFIATGASGMAQNFGSSSTQGSMLVSVSGSENDVITLTDSSGNEMLTWTADKAFDCAIISCPEMKQGETYVVSAGNTSQEVTMDSLIYGSGGMGGARGGMGGQPEAGGDLPGDMRERPDAAGERPEDIGGNSDKGGTGEEM